MLKASAGAEFLATDFTVDFGPVFNLGDTVPITSVGVLDETFVLDFSAAQSGMLVA